jgi:hypothetical protein
VLKALCLAGEDLPGNLIVGSASFDRFERLEHRAVAAVDYPALAEAAMRGSQPGSSAGGEQPKFCAVRDGTSVIVKFSPASDAPVDQRWRDLLVCEHLALETLQDHFIPAAVSQVLLANGRVFLEVERFDRTERGRIGMVSLLAYDSEYVGKIDNWADTAARMAARGLLKKGDAQLLRFLEAFGRLIGNTDRHYGNISLVIDGKGDWQLAPTYDMLPMVYAPVAGEIVERDFDPGELSSTAQTLSEWERARRIAQSFWSRVADDGRISEWFRARAGDHAGQLRGPEQDHAGQAPDEPVFQRSRPS